MPKISGFSSLDAIADKVMTDKISGKIAAGENAMVCWWTFKAGSEAAAHSHDNEQVAWLMSGRMEFRLGDEKRTCEPGDIVVIPAGVEHEAYFPVDSQVVDIFTPPRQDFLRDGAPAYMTKD